MKNSLFKRAAAAVATVPLALGQCLTYSSFAADDKAAETSTTAAASEKVTLDTLLYINPTEFEGYSQWNTQAAAILDKAANKSGTINVDSIINTVADKAGSYKEIAKAIASKLEKVEYNVDENGDITVTAKLGNVAEAFNENLEKSFAEMAKQVADKYGVPELADSMKANFAKIDISGTIKVQVLGSMLDAGTKVTANYEFRPTGSKAVYGAADTVKYVKDKLAEFKQAAYDAIDGVDDAIGMDKAGAKAEVDSNMADFNKIANKAGNALTKFANGPKEKKSKSYDTFSAVIADVNKQLAKYNRSIPESGAKIASNATLVKYFNDYKAKAENATPYTFDITADQIGAFADSLGSINVEAQTGNFKLEGIFADAEALEVKEAYDSTHDDTEYVDSYKIFTVTADASKLESGSATVDVKIQRKITTKPKTVTSSSTTTTTTTTTTTSTSIPEDVVVTTSFKSALPEISADYGFYTEIDEKFALGQIKTAKLVVTYAKGYTKADGTKVDLAPETETIDLTSSITYGDKTPANTYSADSKDFKYAVPVVATDDIKDSKGNVVFAKGATVGTVTAYIGLKGDANLDGKLTAVDASYILKYYAELSSGKDGAEVDPLTVTLCRENELVTDPAGVYDNFAAFLGDVRNDVNADIAWSVGKIGRNDGELKRQASATDASAFLKYYALVSGNDEPGKATWAKVLEG